MAIRAPDGANNRHPYYNVMVMGQYCQTMATFDEKIVQQESERARGAFFL